MVGWLPIRPRSGDGRDRTGPTPSRKGAGRARVPGQEPTGPADAAAPRAGRTSPACVALHSVGFINIGRAFARTPVASGRRQVSSARPAAAGAGERTADRGGWALHLSTTKPGPPRLFDTSAQGLAIRTRRPRCRTCCGYRWPAGWCSAPPGPGRARSLFCYPVSVDEWPDDPDIVERTRLRSCVRRGGAIDVVLDRSRVNRSQIAFTKARGRDVASSWRSPVPHPPERWYPASGQTASGPAVSHRSRIA